MRREYILRYPNGEWYSGLYPSRRTKDRSHAARFSLETVRNNPNPEDGATAQKLTWELDPIKDPDED
jgi:hypothetical protein